MHLPALVTEMPLDLTADTRLRVGGQAAADRRIEVVDRLEQPDVPNLHQFFGRLRAVPVSQHAGLDQRLVSLDEDRAGRFPGPAALRLRSDQGQQLGVRTFSE